MRNMTEAEKNKWLENGAKEVTIGFSDGTAPITNEDIVQESMHIDKTLSDESNIKYGKCSASCFRITIFATDTSYVGKKFSVDISTGNSTLSFGKYTAYSEERTSNKMQKILTAYDDMYRIANTDVAEWYNGLTFPISMKQFRGAFFNYFDIQEVPINLLFDNMLLEKTIYAEQISGLDIIQSICEINACFGQINNEGRFEYVTLNKPSVYTDDNTFYPSEYHMNGLNYEDYVTQPITKVVIRQSSDDVGGSYGEEGNVLAIENNLFVYGKDTEELIEMSRLIYDRVKDKGYNPSSLVMDFQPHLELGDFIKVITPNNEEIEFPILYRSIKGIVALKDEVRASGERTYATITNSIEKKVVQLQGKYNKITTNVDEFKVEVGATYQKKSDMSDYATVERTSNLEQTVEGITAQVKSIEDELNGSLKTYNVEGEPTLQNYPAYDFTYSIPCNDTIQLGDGVPFVYKNEWFRKSLGSVAFDIENSLAYKFSYNKDTDSFYWNPETNTDFGIAMEKIAKLELTAEGLTSDVSETRKTVSAQGEQIIQNTSQIQQNANNIALKVDSNGVINAINVSSEGVGINASKVDVNGVVNIINGGRTTKIDGDKIETKSLIAENILVKDNEGHVLLDAKADEGVKIANFNVMENEIYQEYTTYDGSGIMNIGNGEIYMSEDDSRGSHIMEIYPGGILLNGGDIQMNETYDVGIVGYLGQLDWIGEMVSSSKTSSLGNATTSAKTVLSLTLPHSGLWHVVGKVAFDSTSGTKAVGLATSGTTTTGEFANRTYCNGTTIHLQVDGYFNISGSGNVNLNAYASSTSAMSSANLRGVLVSPLREELH